MTDWAGSGTPIGSTTPVLTGEYYATYANVIDILRPQLPIGTDETIGQLTETTVNAFLDDACGMIDNMISHMWIVPLRKYSSRGVLVYPPQIVTATSCLCSAMIINKFFAEQNPNMSDRAKELVTRHDVIMNKILDGISLLPGQRRMAKSHFMTPSIQESPSRDDKKMGE